MTAEFEDCLFHFEIKIRLKTFNVETGWCGITHIHGKVFISIVLEHFSDGDEKAFLVGGVACPAGHLYADTGFCAVVSCAKLCAEGTGFCFGRIVSCQMVRVIEGSS